MKQTVKDGQTLADVAIQEYGSWEAMISISRENGISMTEVPNAGTELTMPDATWNRTMQNYCKSNDVSPATARDQGNVSLRIFDEEFNETFK
ncbi:MAG: LysM domain-containing protein [Paraprevotella sp.]|nr:LysM domain-containing protein [Paraprevotella sp.]